MAGEVGPPEPKSVPEWKEVDPAGTKQQLLLDYIYFNHTYDEWLQELYDQIAEAVPLSSTQAARLSWKIADEFESRLVAHAAPDPQNPNRPASGPLG